MKSTKQSVCNGDGFTLSLLGATELTNITYQWQKRPVGASTFTDINEANKTFLNINDYQQTTEFRCKVTCISTMDSSFSDILAVAILSLPINLGADTTVCNGNTLNLDAGVGGTEYEWSTGNDTRMISISEGDRYWARISNSEGCIGMDTIMVSFLGKPSAAGINASAYDLTYVFRVTDAKDVIAYEWRFGDGKTDNAPNPLHIYEKAGIYNVSVVLTNECDSITLNQSITATEPPPTGIDAAGSVSGMNIYPVPVKGLLHLNAPATMKGADIVVWDIDGKQKDLRRISGGESVQINTSLWPSGIYIIKIISDKGVDMRKIIVE